MSIAIISTVHVVPADELKLPFMHFQRRRPADATERRTIGRRFGKHYVERIAER